MTRLAALDLGSNSFHLLVADKVAGGRIKRVHTRKITLRLAEPVLARGKLGKDAYRRALDAIAELLDEARDEGATQGVAVATDALRLASDGAAWCDEVRGRHGLEVQLLTGLDEGALSLRGVAAALELPPERRLLGLDLGGGSYEVTYGGRERAVVGASLPLGAARVADGLHDPPRMAEVTALHDAATIQLHGVAEKVAAARTGEHAKGDGQLRAVGTAGTIRDLGRFSLALASGAAPPKVRGLLVSRSQLEMAVARLSSLSLAERMELPGISPKRADILPAGGIVLLATMEAFELERLELSDWGLREGVLLDVVGPGDIVEPDRLAPLR